MDNCIFCKIASGKAPCYKIYEDELTLAFLDISKDTFGHTLVVPKSHCTNILDCPDDVLAAVIKTVKKVSNHYVQNCGFKGVNILNASGEEAQQSVFHLHFHILPRMDKDEMDAFPKLFGTINSLEEQQLQLKLDF